MENNAIDNEAGDKEKSGIEPTEAEKENVDQPENIPQGESTEGTDIQAIEGEGKGEEVGEEGLEAVGEEGGEGEGEGGAEVVGEEGVEGGGEEVGEGEGEGGGEGKGEGVGEEGGGEGEGVGEGEGGPKEGEEKKEEKAAEIQEIVQEEEEQFVEEPPPDPAEPYNLTDSSEALKPPFELRHDQLSEVEQLWALYQDYNPAYTDIDDYITEKELIYMLKSLLLMTYTPEQLQELIVFCVRPPHPEGHITFEQFVKIVTIRQRSLPIEEELRLALQSLDPAKTGLIDREFFKELLSKQGHKLSPKMLDNLIKEVDLSNDGTIGIEDVVGTLGIDLNKDDIAMLRAAVYPDENPQKEEEEF